MKCLIDKDGQGNWALHEVRWDELYPGSVITPETYDRLDAALSKLMEYEASGLSPEEVEQLVNKRK